MWKKIKRKLADLIRSASFTEVGVALDYSANWQTRVISKAPPRYPLASKPANLERGRLADLRFRECYGKSMLEVILELRLDAIKHKLKLKLKLKTTSIPIRKIVVMWQSLG